MTKVSVVILNFNGSKFLKQFLPSILSFSGDAEIVVADNASTDDSISLLKSEFPSVRLIEFNENHGFAGGYNEALKQIDAEYFAIINSDVEVTKDWLDGLVSYLDGHPDHVAVQPKILDWNNKDSFEYAGACGGFVDKLGYPYCRGRIFETIEKDQGQYNDVIDVDWTSGACMVIRSDTFHEVGGFDTSFFAHMEEIDMCWRIRSSGGSLACLPSQVVYHVGGGTLNKTSPFKTYLNFRNGLSLLVKNLPFSQLIWKLPFRLVLDGLAAMKFSIESSPRHMLAILKAHVHFYARFPKTWVKRAHVSKPRNINILSYYFIKSRRVFSKID